MPIPEFIVELRRHIGHAPLWLPGCTAVVLRDLDGLRNVLLARRSDTGEWAPITGIVDPGEHPHVAAVREVAEEAGVTAEVERLVWVRALDLHTHVNGDQSYYLDHTFRLRWVSGEPLVGDDESLEVGWFPVEALPPMSERMISSIAAVMDDAPEVRLG